MSETQPTPKRSRRWLWIAAGLVLIGLIVVVVVMLVVSRDDNGEKDEDDNGQTTTEAACEFQPGDGTVLAYETTSTADPDEATELSADQTYPVIAMEEGFYSVELDNGGRGWVPMEQGTLVGNCEIDTETDE